MQNPQINFNQNNQNNQNNPNNRNGQNNQNNNNNFSNNLIDFNNPFEQAFDNPSQSIYGQFIDLANEKFDLSRITNQKK